jgi:hypothetical protein
MFDIEFILKAVALIVAVGLLLSSVDFTWILAKISIKNEADEDKVVPTIPKINEADEGSSFLKTLQLWYLLKKQCEEHKLTEASKKMDEVFPLLNDNMED